MPLRVRRLRLALRYLAYLLALGDDHLAKLALEEAFALARAGFPSWISDLRHALDAYLPLHLHSYERLHDASCLAGLETALVDAADQKLAQELGGMSRLRLWSARPDSKVRAMRRYLATNVPAHRKALTRLLLSDHGLAVEIFRRPERARRAVTQREDRLCRMCRGAVEDEVHVMLQCCGCVPLVHLREAFMDELAVLSLRAPAFEGGREGELVWWLADHADERVRAAWAHFVYRVFSLVDNEQPYVLPQYKVLPAE